MRISPQCYGCLERLAEQALSSATDQSSLRETARAKAGSVLRNGFRPGEVSVVIASAILKAIQEVTGNNDPYRGMKDIEVETAKDLYDTVKDRFGGDFPGLLKLAALGNSIDFFRPIEEVKREVSGQDIDFAIDDSALLVEKVTNAGLILYLADNSGEMFFDMPLLNLMRKYGRTVYVVKESPVQNDITLEEIRRAGLESEAGEVMTTGTATAGIDFRLASAGFKDMFNRADFVLAKGMGYYETLEELPAEGRIFFCLKAKCTPVATSLKVPLHSYIAMLH